MSTTIINRQSAPKISREATEVSSFLKALEA
jgi:hypothetical protein